MRFKVKAAEIHNPLFMGSENLGQKFGEDKAKRADALEYDTVLQCLIVRHKGKVALVALPTVAFMEIANPADIDPPKKILKTSPEDLKTA